MKSDSITQRLPLAATVKGPGVTDLHSTSASSNIWLCLYFPYLSLEVVFTDFDNQRACAVTEERAGRVYLFALSLAALRYGLSPGMTLGSAYALCDVLHVAPRDRGREQQCLEQLVREASAFSSELSVLDSQALVLEVARSLKLFNGFSALRQAIQAWLSLSHSTIWQQAAAPTPLAAYWLARLGRDVLVEQKEALRSALGPLPLDALDLQTQWMQKMHKLGLRHLCDLWRLPRAGLARRFGSGFLALLDRVLGASPDLHPYYYAPEVFVAKREIGWDAQSTEDLWPFLTELLTCLQNFLTNKSAAVELLYLTLHFNNRRQHAVSLTLRQAQRDGVILLKLLRERLRDLRWEAPVVALELVSGPVQFFVPQTQELFPSDSVVTEQESQMRWNLLLETVQARCGSVALRQLEAMADHQPERAQRYCRRAHLQETSYELRLRPVWLLRVAERLTGCPPSLVYRSTLRLMSGPERVETGWWETTRIGRDYYIAEEEGGARLWVFRDLKQPTCWYVHGFFG